MKKLVVICILVAALVFSLTACTEETNTEERQLESVTREEESPKAEEPSETADEPEEPAEDAVAEVEEEPETTTAPEEPVKDVKEEPAKVVTPEPAKVDLSAINKEIMVAIGATDGLEFSINSMNALYGIAASDIKQCAGFSVMAGTFPHEVVMIEAADDQAAQRIGAAFESKINTFAEQSRNYDARNYALAQKCTVQKNGRFYALFLSPDYDGIKAVYNKYVK